MHQFQGIMGKGQGQLLLRPKVFHIYRTDRLTNFNIGTPMEHDIPTATANTGL